MLYLWVTQRPLRLFTFSDYQTKVWLELSIITYAIYDSRVAVSLNYIVARKGDRGRDERRGFPVPSSKNAHISNARKVCKTLSQRFGIACHDKSSFYLEYCRCIAKSANILSKRLNRRICMHRVEMMLFALAEQSAHGLFAFERFSSPL